MNSTKLRRLRPLSEAEQAVMDHVWTESPVSAEACREALRERWPMKESTMRTVLRRLEAKGYVTHTTEARTFLYRPTHAPLRVAAHAVRLLIDRFCGGSAEQLVAGLVDAEVLSAAELERLARRIAQQKSRKK